MPDSKVSDLTAVTDPTSDDVLYLVDDPGGTPGSRKVTMTNLLKKLFGDMDANAQVISGHEAGINAQTGTTYGSVASDSGKVITLNNGSAITITVGSALPAGWHCQIVQMGAGQVTVAAGGTGNLRNRSSHTKLAGQYGMATLFIESNAGTAPEVILAGDTAA